MYSFGSRRKKRTGTVPIRGQRNIERGNIWSHRAIHDCESVYWALFYRETFQKLARGIVWVLLPDPTIQKASKEILMAKSVVRPIPCSELVRLEEIWRADISHSKSDLENRVENDFDRMWKRCESRRDETAGCFKDCDTPISIRYRLASKTKPTFIANRNFYFLFFIFLFWTDCYQFSPLSPQASASFCWQCSIQHLFKLF